MTATMIASALFLAAQAVTVPAAASDGIEQRDVAYEQLSAGNADGVIATLKRRLRESQATRRC